MYENYNDIARELGELLESCGKIGEDIAYDEDEILKAIEVSNENLEKEFEKIDKIQVESLKAALSEEIFL